jgi:hypothetical protein
MQNEIIYQNAKQNTCKTFSVSEIMNAIETWLVSGVLNQNIFSDNFQFTSPFWKGANKTEFMIQFGDPKSYQEVALSKITHFDPIIQLKSSDGSYFAIVLQYHTQNGGQVYETVLGRVNDGLLVELRSIYDLDETKTSLEIS